MQPKQCKDELARDNPEALEANEAKSILEKGQTSFVDEQPRRGKQFESGRKVADLEHVGAATPDTDHDGLPKRGACAPAERRSTR